MTQDEFNAWIRARFNLWTKSDVDTEIRKSVEQALAQRTWAGLTDEEIKTICSENGWDSSWQSLRFARAIKAKLKEKNS